MMPLPFGSCWLMALALVPASLAQAAETVPVVQSGRAFSVAAVSLQRGDVLRLINHDEFLHQAYTRTHGA